MNFNDILNKQKKILEKLYTALQAEKEKLIIEDSKGLMDIIDEKSDCLKQLDFLENERTKKEQLDASASQQTAINKTKIEIKTLLERIREAQQINSMLTRQSLDYQAVVMDIIQKTLSNSGITYGKQGNFNKVKEVNTSFNRSV